MDSASPQPRRARPNARLYALIARDARRAVVLRRGPSRSVLALAWDLTTDTLTAGQWFKGRIYERRCDLSPDGEMLVYFAGYRGQFRSWTAISRPPYFTALALWPKGDGWGGGGLFPDNHSIELNHRPPTDERAICGDETQLAPGFSTPPGFRTGLFGPAPGWGEDEPIYSAREARDGWTVATELDRTVDHGHDSPRWISFDPPGVVEKPLGRTGARLQVALHGIKERDGRWYVETAQIVGRSDEVLADLGRIDWAGVDHNGDALYAQDGRLYRIAAPGKKAAPPLASRLVADLNDLRFQRLTTPPEALVWPKSARAADFAKR